MKDGKIFINGVEIKKATEFDMLVDSVSEHLQCSREHTIGKIELAMNSHTEEYFRGQFFQMRMKDFQNRTGRPRLCRIS